MKAPARPQRVVRRSDDVTETIAASVPSSLAREVRESVAKGEFSRFVAQALRTELVRLRRERYIAEAEKHHGPVDMKEVERIRRLLRDS